MKHSYQPQTRPGTTDDQSSPLSRGTHSITVSHGPHRVEQTYHVAGSGPVCVAHSGGPGIGWEYLRMLGLEECLTMVYIEPVGTGHSGRLPDPQDYTVATYASLLHQVVEHLGLPQVTLLGHSHGGFVAQRYALDHPDRLASLVLYDTSPVADEWFWSEAVAAMERFVQRHVDDHPEVAGYVAALNARLDLMDDEGTTAVLRQIMPAYLFDYWGREKEFGPARRSLRMYAAPTRGQSAPFDVRDELSGITTPTLVLAGRQDFICGPRWARLLVESMPAAELSILEDTGHLAHIERPARFSASILAFLRAHGVLDVTCNVTRVEEASRSDTAVD
ncbi:alpha/beta fold hydrolase [Streptomyces sp. NPDC006527]|uniref:alpha/beta fold hydrolase n=1 Tax=Streptomyces sp. NPDC006527 TaxID=3364749 RepID=UPI003699FB70